MSNQFCDSHSLEKRARQAFGNYLALVPFDQYATLTFKRADISLSSAQNHFHKWFNIIREDIRFWGPATSRGVNQLNAGSHFIPALNPYYFRATERQQRGTWHFHVLVGGLQGNDLHFGDSYWSKVCGFSKIEPFNAHGAEYYCSKYVTKQGCDADWLMSHSFPHCLPIQNDYGLL